MFTRRIATASFLARGFATSESNVATATNRLEKTLEKFWNKVSVQDYQGGEGKVIALDSKPIKTPLGMPLVIPNVKQQKSRLASLIGHEWSLLTSLKIKRHAVPLTAIAARAIDLATSAEGPAERQRVIEHLLPYLDTDTLLIFSPLKDCDGELRPAQEQLFHPVIKNAEKFWDVELRSLDTEVTLYGNRQSEETKEKVLKWMESLDHWQLAALERATTAAKSLIGAMNIITHQMTAEQVAKLVNLEVDFQTRQWGEVEDTHDVDHADLRRLLGSSYILAK